MMAITVQQPWAWAIIHGGKNVENRTNIAAWRRLTGQRIAIHAGARWSHRGQATLARAASIGDLTGTPPVGRDGYPTGVVIGTVHIDDVHPAAHCCTPWGEHVYRDATGRIRTSVVHLVLTDPHPIDPIPARGRLGIWHLDTASGQ
jgi:hypothetical protein